MASWHVANMPTIGGLEARDVTGCPAREIGTKDGLMTCDTGYTV